MKPRTYLSSEQTKQELAQALKELMQEKSLEHITIHDLTERCHIRRQTFYYHFQDIYDLLCWMFQQEVLPLLQDCKGPKLWQDGLLQLFRYLDANREICLCALHSSGHVYLRRFFETEIDTLIRETIEQIGRTTGALNLVSTEEDIAFMTQFYKVAFAALLESWLLGELHYTPEELVAFSDQMIQDHIRGAHFRAEHLKNELKSSNSIT